MRNRDKKISDFGMTRKQSWDFYRACRKFTPSEKYKLQSVALECCRDPAIAGYIVESLCCNRSYDEISKTRCIALGCDDFYGYRRATVAKYFGVVKNGKSEIQKVADS